MTGRGNVPTRVADLHVIRGQARPLDISTDEDIQDAYQLIISAMDYAITAFRNFMSEDEYQSDFASYRSELEKWQAALAEIRAK